MGEIYCSGFREKLDALITDYPIAECKTVVEEDTNLLYMDVSGQSSSLGFIDYRYDGALAGMTSIGGVGEPSIGQGTEGVLTGSYLIDPSHSESLGFYDGDNHPDEGYFLMMVVKFDQWVDRGGMSKPLPQKRTLVDLP